MEMVSRVEKHKTLLSLLSCLRHNLTIDVILDFLLCSDYYDSEGH